MEDEDILLDETPEMIIDDSVNLFATLLKDAGPHQFSRTQISRLGDAMQVAIRRLDEAEKTIVRDCEILGEEDEEETMENEEEMERICDIMKSTDIDGSIRNSPATSSSSDYSEPSSSASEDDPANVSNVDFNNFVTANKCFLKIKRFEPFCEKEFRKEQIRYPLGVVCDEIRKCWIICDKTDKVFKINMDGKKEGRVSVIKHESIKFPSAVTVYKEGKSVAVLCSENFSQNYWITIVDHTSKSTRRQVTEYCSYRDREMRMHHPCRGLAKSIGENLMTIDIPPAPRPPRLRIFSPKTSKQTSFVINAAKRPSFIASSSNRVAISDLGAHMLFLLKVDDSNWDQLHTCEISIIAVVDSNYIPKSPKALSDSKYFCFIAGVQFDKEGKIMVGDARGHNLKLYTDKLEYIQRVSSGSVIPYMSSFCVNQKGQMLMIDIHGENKIIMGQLTGCEEVMPWVDGCNPRRAPERSRFSNRRLSPVRSSRKSSRR